MRIFLSCLQSPRRHPIPSYSFWEPYFKQGIAEGGHSWVEAPGVDWAEGLAVSDEEELEAWRQRTWEATLEAVAAEHRAAPIDLFLGYLYPRQVSAEAVRHIQSLGIPCVNFFCDNVRQFKRLPGEYAVFDAHWVPERKAVALYRAAGHRVVEAPMPVWVPPERRRADHVEEFGPTFIGSHDVQRERLFADAVRLGAPIDIRGPGWDGSTTPLVRPSRAPRSLLRNQLAVVRDQGARALLGKVEHALYRFDPPAGFRAHVKETVFGDQYFAVTQRSEVTIGVNRYPSLRHSFARPDTYSRLRDIEAPMLGACYLTEWTEGLDELYALGEEIETYRTAEEMVERIAALQRDPERRRRLREKGQRRALADHCVPRTIERIARAVA